MTGSLTAVLTSPGSATRLCAASNPAGLAASISSTRQCLVPKVPQLRYSRQVPSGVRISAGRSSDSALTYSLVIVSSVSKCSPSPDLATATA